MSNVRNKLPPRQLRQPTFEVSFNCGVIRACHTLFTVALRKLRYAEGVCSLSPASLTGEVLVARKERGERVAVCGSPGNYPQDPYAESVESSELHATL